MRHPVSTTHLVLGLVFLGIASTWALRASGMVDPDSSPWLLPAFLLGAGAVGVLTSVLRSVSRPGRRSGGEEYAEDGQQAGDLGDDPWTMR